MAPPIGPPSALPTVLRTSVAMSLIRSIEGSMPVLADDGPRRSARSLDNSPHSGIGMDEAAVSEHREMEMVPRW